MWDRLRYSWIDRLHEAGQSWWQALPLGSHRLRQLAISIPVVFRRQRPAHQSGLADRGWTVAGERLSSVRSFPQTTSTTTPSFLSNTGCSRQPGPTSAPGRAQICGRLSSSSAMTRRTGWRTTRSSGALKARFDGAYYLEWPAELVQREPAALDRVATRTGGSDRPGALRAVPAVPPGRAAQGTCPQQGRGLDRRPALLRLSRLERRVGEPGAVSAGRAAPAALRRRCASRLLQRAGTALGQSHLRLGRSSARPAIVGASTALRALLAHVDVIRLDHFRGFAAAWHVPAGAATAQSGSWVPGPGRRFLSGGAERVRRSAVHRRGPWG